MTMMMMLQKLSLSVFLCYTLFLGGENYDGFVQGWISSSSSFITSRSRSVSLSYIKQQQQQQQFTTNGCRSNSQLYNNNKFNVVLEPSYNDPNAFDSFKIGSPKVHRYSRTSNNYNNNEEDGSIKASSATAITSSDAFVDETEYVMWYHGRSTNFDTENYQKNNNQTAVTTDNRVQLPPLSTGRIGRATSRNGLVWKKQTVGSQSEDRTDVTLGLNQESWWSFDTTHVGLGTVLLPMSTPAVMTQGSGIYLLFYMGGNGEMEPMSNYMSTEDDTKMIQGMNLKIGVALSQDGITFGRVEGDDPSGAIVVPNDDELYCAWPEVMVNQDRLPEETFNMYYSTMVQSTKQKCIAHAVSSDGFRWYKKGICLQPDEASNIANDGNGCSRCCVVKDVIYDEAKYIWIDQDNTYTMYYEGVSSVDQKHRIFQAQSTDGGKTWTKQGIAFDLGNTNDWDCSGVGSPHIIRLDDGSSRMYYVGQGMDGSTAIGVAKDADGSGKWVREQATISLTTIA